MNGIHDIGGMQGFGRIEREVTEPVFREEWERRTFGTMLLFLASGIARQNEEYRRLQRLKPYKNDGALRTFTRRTEGR